MSEPMQNSSYPSNAPRASRALMDILVKKITQDGPIPFSTFMEQALYHPIHGYYLQPGLEVGKYGDFYTSVSVGPCFGLLLGKRLARLWEQMGRPQNFTLSEAGAHHGQLAADILRSVKGEHPEFFQALSYRIVEPHAALQKQQQQQLEDFADKCSWAQNWSSLRAVSGAIISNELFDAFPVDLITLQSGQWMERRVGVENGNLIFVTSKLTKDELKKLTETLSPVNFPHGYTSEYAIGIESWAKKALSTLSEGLWLSIDYGFSHEDYYLPERSDGTLRGYRNHQVVKHVLENPGRQDLTADVDFTRLMRAGKACGFVMNGFADQARYLTALAKDWMIELEKSGSAVSNPLLRQFQTLTHPSKLGLRFKALEMTTVGLEDQYPFIFSPQNRAD